MPSGKGTCTWKVSLKLMTMGYGTLLRALELECMYWGHFTVTPRTPFFVQVVIPSQGEYSQLILDKVD